MEREYFERGDLATPIPGFLKTSENEPLTLGQPYVVLRTYAPSDIGAEYWERIIKIICDDWKVRGYTWGFKKLRLLNP